MNFRKNKLDANHLSIVAALEKCGVIVEQLMHPVDILGSYKGFTGFAEIKIEGSKAKYTRVQLRWIVKTPFPIAIVHNLTEAFEYFANGKGLSDGNKYRLRQLLDANHTRQFFTPAEVDKALRVI